MLCVLLLCYSWVYYSSFYLPTCTYHSSPLGIDFYLFEFFPFITLITDGRSSLLIGHILCLPVYYILLLLFSCPSVVLLCFFYPSILFCFYLFLPFIHRLLLLFSGMSYYYCYCYYYYFQYMIGVEARLGEVEERKYMVPSPTPPRHDLAFPHAAGLHVLFSFFFKWLSLLLFNITYHLSLQTGYSAFLFGLKAFLPIHATFCNFKQTKNTWPCHTVPCLPSQPPACACPTLEAERRALLPTLSTLFSVSPGRWSWRGGPSSCTACHPGKPTSLCFLAFSQF